MKNRLARQIAFDVAIVTCGVMLLYAFYQSLTGEAGPFEFFLRHLWHPIVLTILVYGFLLLRLRSRFLRPLELLFWHAQDISRGVFENCDYPKARNEIDQVTTMMNQMAKHLATIKKTSWKEYADTIERHLDRLREKQDLPIGVQEELLEIRDSIRKMEITIVGFKEGAGPVIRSYGGKPVFHSLPESDS